jgi:hypothetical protein
MSYEQEALSAAQDSVDLWHQLASQDEKVYGPGLAESLIELSSTMRSLGRRTDALAAIQEASDLFRRLAQDEPAFEPRLASALNEFSIALRVTGRVKEAIQVAEEGIQLLIPVFLSLPQTYRLRMQNLLQTYLESCRRVSCEPNLELTGPIEEALENLVISQECDDPQEI